MEDEETQTLPFEHTPLLPSDRERIRRLQDGDDLIGRHILTVHGEESWVWQTRHALQKFLSSKWGHYAVILLVACDVAGIFADFLISLHICENSGKKGFNAKPWIQVDDALDIVSLVFSCLFMAELVLSVYAFGLAYFKSSFHCFDATVIVAGFIVDVLLRGAVEEAGSLVVVGRLWRVFKIIEEFSSGADDQIEELEERVEKLEKENEELRKKAGSNGKPAHS